MKSNSRRDSRGGSLRVRYVGPADACWSHLRSCLQAKNHVFLETQDDSSPCDVLIDRMSTSASEVRAAFVAAAPMVQSILVSSFAVYPITPHLTPWSVSDIDISSDLPPWSNQQMLAARAMERDLRLIARGTPITVLRSAPLEGGASDLGVSAWAVARILDGAKIVLPDGDLPSYRICTMIDLANAIDSVIGEAAAFDQTYNVVNQALLSYWGHAALARDALRKNLEFHYVPADQWKAAGLQLPGVTLAPAALLATSAELLGLGWRSEDPVTALHSRAQEVARSHDSGGTRAIATEHRLLAQIKLSTSLEAPLPSRNTRQWKLSAWAGQPASLSLSRQQEPHLMPNPLIKVRALVLQGAEERFLRGEYLQSGERAIGHNALVEVLRVTPNQTNLRAGQRALPVSAMPCHDSACALCGNGYHGVLGIGCDGYGLGVCTTPAGHLVPIDDRLGLSALLADSLASLIYSIEEKLGSDKTPVWIAGRTAEAALTAWLAQDAGRHVVHVDRRDWAHPEFPVTAIEPLLERLNRGEFERPTLVLDFTGSAEVSWPLSHALAKGGHLYVRRRPPGIADGIHWHELPAAAPNRAALELAIARLKRWANFRDLSKRIGPPIPLDHYWDALLPHPFSLPYLEDAT